MCNDDEDGSKNVAKNSFKLNGVYLADRYIVKCGRFFLELILKDCIQAQIKKE